MVGNWQKGFETVSSVEVCLLEAENNVRAGLTAFYTESYHYEIYITKEMECPRSVWQNIYMIFMWLQQKKKFLMQKILF